MRWLIRRVLRRSQGAISFEDDVQYGDVLGIGRATDQEIFLPDLHVALRHARIGAVDGGKFRVESLILAGIRVDGQIVQTAVVDIGAVIEFGSTRLKIVAPSSDEDVAIEITTLASSDQQAQLARRAAPTTLVQTRLGKRLPSWIGFLAVLALTLLVPAASHFAPEAATWIGSHGLPGTAIWNPGPLVPAHRYFGDDCTTCHKRAFESVRDEACLTCHTNLHAHADPVRFAAPELGQSCTACHHDHNGAGGLIRTDQRLCSTCHGDPKQHSGEHSELADISDFGLDHPQFRVQLPAWGSNGTFAPKQATWSPTLREASGLEFNHAKHLVAKGLSTPDGHRVLACADCHQPEPGGARMQPMRYETLCHDCHRLGFDTLAPEREVPHGQVAAVVYTLEEYYAKAALDGGYASARAPTIVQQRRRPGQQAALTREERQIALDWARDRAREVASTLFTGKACTTCHAVTAPTGTSGWQIAPVRVAGAWYADAHFTHARHATMGCVDCHGAAEHSETAADLLIPGIENCRQCHGGDSTSGKVPTPCVACHAYHRDADLLQAALHKNSIDGTGSKSAPANESRETRNTATMTEL